MKCDICKGKLLTTRDIGYVSSHNGVKVFECRRCHAHRKHSYKKTGGDWLLLS